MGEEWMNARQRKCYATYMKASNRSVQELQTLIATRLRLEDQQYSHERQCRVREYPDFREQADVLEQVLKDRSIAFQPIDWSDPEEA